LSQAKLIDEWLVGQGLPPQLPMLKGLQPLLATAAARDGAADGSGSSGGWEGGSGSSSSGRQSCG
jgi:hypothetical protein